MSFRYIDEQNKDACLHGVYIPLGEIQKTINLVKDLLNNDRYYGKNRAGEV